MLSNMGGRLSAAAAGTAAASASSLAASASAALSWPELEAAAESLGPLSSLSPASSASLRAAGPTNAQASFRQFDGSEDPAAARVVLYRDNHAWCPYCQKVWLWLEEKRVPYRIEKITMFCYGDKEPWYRRIVPSGMLPALSIDGQIITESDEILYALEGK